MKQHYGTTDIARLCNVSPRTVAKWIDNGNLKGTRLAGGRHRRVSRADLITFLQIHFPEVVLDV